MRVVPDVSTEVVGERASSTGVLLFSAMLFAVVLGAGLFIGGRVTLGVVVAATVAALLAIGCCHIAQQWERVVVLRLGRFSRVSGPGLFWTIPVIESNAMRVDTRTRVTTFYAEQRKKARIILMEAEHDIYEILDEMEGLVGDHEAVTRLRTMHLLNESLREGKGTVVISSAFAEGFNEGVGDLFKG